MKVVLPEGYKDKFTRDEIDAARRIIKEQKEDEYTPKDWAEYAIREALEVTEDTLNKVIEATATITRNARARDEYGAGTGRLDIWIKATARTYYGYIDIGAFLSDIYDTGGKHYRQHMYIQRYTRP